jgi:hypothetical protein
VPLGVRSYALFHVINCGYENLELRFRLPADESHQPLQLEFPEVRGLGVQGSALSLYISPTITCTGIFCL